MNRNEEYINNYHDPLEESYYNSPLYNKYLLDEHFHHSEKNCDIEMIENNAKGTKGEAKSINKFCKTHNVMCSKTGWELGWYMGINNRYTERIRECLNCQKPITKPMIHQKYCSECKTLVSRFKAFLHVSYYKEPRLYPNIKHISLQILKEFQKKYTKDNSKVLPLINYQIENYATTTSNREIFK